MKNILFISFIVLIVAGSCCLDPNETIYGNGNVVSEERIIGDFDALKVSSGIDVIIKQGSALSLMVEADENLLPVQRSIEQLDQLLQLAIAFGSDGYECGMDSGKDGCIVLQASAELIHAARLD